MRDSLTNWYLNGTTLHPTPENLRAHVTALANNQVSTTLTLTFTDHRTITLSHAQLSVSPLPHLTPFTSLTLPTTSTPFSTIRHFIYCTPVDLSATTLPLVKAARSWGLTELYTACFLVAETARLNILQLVERYIPLVTYHHTPNRFKAFLAARVAVNAPDLIPWLPQHTHGTSNNERLLQMFARAGMVPTVRNALRLHSEVAHADIFGHDAHTTTTQGRAMALFWRVPLAELLCSQREYYECDVSTDGANGYVELTWDTRGAGLIVGLHEVDGEGLVDVTAAIVGMACDCADVVHNQGWSLEGGVERRALAWVTTHEVAFSVFDGPALREWREKHADCEVRVKVRIVVGGEESESEESEESESETECEGGSGSGSESEG